MTVTPVNFGGSISIDGTQAAIVGYDRVFLYQWNGSEWSYTDTKVVAEDRNRFEAVKLIGNTLVVAEQTGLTTTINIFSDNEGTWQLQQKIPYNKLYPGDKDLAFAGTRILFNNTIYEKQGSLWVETENLYGTLNADTDGPVSLDGNRAAISTWNEVFIFEYQNGRWLELGHFNSHGALLSGNDLLAFNVLGRDIDEAHFIDLDLFAVLPGCESNTLNDADACRPQPRSPIVYEKQKLSAIEALSDDRIFVQNPQPSPGEFSQNSLVQVYEYIDGSWQQALPLIPGSGFSINFGSVVAADGQQALVTAAEGPYGTYDTGAVHSYVFNGSNWQQIRTFNYSDTPLSWGYDFAANLSISGNLAAYSSFHHLPGNPGQVVVLRFDGSDWLYDAVINAPSELQDSTASLFGRRISITENALLIGGFGETYLYEKRNNDWFQSTRFNISGAMSLVNDQFAVISNIVFEQVNGVWSQTQTLAPSDEAARDRFGAAIAATEDSIVIGAPGNNDAGGDSGAAYLFEKNAGVWQEVAQLLPSDGAANAQFGRSVYISEDHIVVNSIGSERAAAAAYYFDRQSLFDRPACVDTNVDGNQLERSEHLR